MADNTTLNPGTGGDIIRAEEKGGAKTQVMLLDIGGLGAESLVDSGNPLPVTVANFPATQPVSAAALPLPAGAATAARQDTGNTSLAAIASALAGTLGIAGTVTVSNLPATQAISAASLPLPSGAATAANQATGNTSLANLDTDLGATSDAAASSDTGSFSLIALVKRMLTKLPVALGQGTMAQSLSVVLASNQSAVNVSPDNVLDSVVTASANVTSATTAVSATMAGFSGGSFHVTNAGTGCTITYEQSDDNTNWVTLPIVNAASLGNSITTVSSAVGVYNFSSSAAFVRARVSTYGSGTVNVTLVQKRAAPPLFLSLGASGANVGNLTRRSGFSDSSTPLAGAATFTGTGRTDPSGNYSRFNANAYADVAGTLFIDVSTDTGSTYRAVAEVALTARTVGFAGSLSIALSGAASSATFYRVRFVNGAGAQAAFQLSSSFTAA